MTASSFGYYVFPPITFSLVWTGQGFTWTYDGAGTWLPLSTAQFPGMVDVFDASAPDDIKGFSPPFLGALQEPGLVQLWTGLVARTAPGWNLLVRPCANLPRSQPIELFEGIIETDRWFGPLITNFRATRTDVPIEFHRDVPLLQVQAIPREALDEKAQNGFDTVAGVDSFDAGDWADFYDTVVRPNVAEQRPRGEYAVAARKRRRDEENGPDA